MPSSRKARLNTALFPIGLVAAVAGCAGGSAVSGTGGTKYIPPAGPQQMVAAQLLVQIPARDASAKLRNPKYYSTRTRIVTLSYGASPLPSPVPSPSVFSVPTPGATPTSFPISVQVPVGTDTFVVNTFDGASCCSTYGTNGYLLSTAQVSATISPNAANSINVVGQAIPANLTYSTYSYQPLANQATDQSITVNVGAYDGGGGSITGPLAGAINVQPTYGPAGAVSVSPSAITTLPTAVTVTYKHANAASVQLALSWSGPSPGIAPYAPSFSLNPKSYIWVPNSFDGTVSILDPSTSYGNIYGSPVSVSGAGVSAPQHIAVQSSVNGCPGGATAIVSGSDTDHVAFITVPVPVPGASPTAPTVYDAGTAASTNPVRAVAFDSSCLAYTGTGYIGSASGTIEVLRSAVNSPISGATAIISSTPGPAPLTDYGSVTAILANGGNVYAAQQTGNIAMYNGSTATSLGIGYGATALGVYGANGFVTVYPYASPAPSPAPMVFATYPGTGAAFDQMLAIGNPGNETITSIVPDGVGSFIAGETGGPQIWQWIPPSLGPFTAANYGVVMVPGSSTQFFAVTDGTPGYISLHSTSSPATVYINYTVGNHPRSIAAGP